MCGFALRRFMHFYDCVFFSRYFTPFARSPFEMRTIDYFILILYILQNLIWLK